MDNKLRTKRRNFLACTLVIYSIALLVFTYIFSASQPGASSATGYSGTDNFFESLSKFSRDLHRELGNSISTLFDYAKFLILFSFGFLIFLHCFVKKLHPVIFFAVPIFQLALTYIIQFLISNLPGMPGSPFHFYYIFTVSYIIATIYLVKLFYADVLNSNYEKTE